jgi:hypothetical protein
MFYFTVWKIDVSVLTISCECSKLHSDAAGGANADADGGDDGRGGMPSLSQVGQAVARLEDAAQRQLRRVAHARHELSSNQRRLDLLSIRFGRVCDTLAGLSNEEEHLKVKEELEWSGLAQSITTTDVTGTSTGDAGLPVSLSSGSGSGSSTAEVSHVAEAMSSTER